MPTYEYECSACKHTFEEFQSISDPPLKKCPKCGGKVKRMIGVGAGIIFKGTGFYETDYKRKTGSGGSKYSSFKTDKSSKSSSESVKENCSASDRKKEHSHSNINKKS
jgi:putative FmdB family regulatory protein